MVAIRICRISIIEPLITKVAGGVESILPSVKVCVKMNVCDNHRNVTQATRRREKSDDGTSYTRRREKSDVITSYTRQCAKLGGDVKICSRKPN